MYEGRRGKGGSVGELGVRSITLKLCNLRSASEYMVH